MRAPPLALLLLLAAPAAAGDAVPSGLSPARLQRVSQALAAEVEAGHIPGGVVLVAQDGAVKLSAVKGLMDRETKRPVRRDTIFRIYSMTKPVTAVAALQLCEQKKLRLDDPVAKYLPQLRGLRPADPKTPSRSLRPMTIRDLLRHTSGLVYGWGQGPVDQAYREANVLDRSGTLAQMVDKLSKIPLAFAPGTRWEYSVSSDVLGRVVEVVSGERLDRYFQRHIFGPLKMVDTGFFVPKEKLDRFAANYTKTPSGLKLRDAPRTSRFAKPTRFFSGGGGLVSTADDYLAFAQALLHDGAWRGARILRPETVRAMTRDQLPKGVPCIRFGTMQVRGMGFGLGVSVATTDLGGFAAEGEFGWGGAASTTFFVSARDRLVVVIMTQVMPRTVQLDMKLRPLVYAARRWGPL